MEMVWQYGEHRHDGWPLRGSDLFYREGQVVLVRSKREDSKNNRVIILCEMKRFAERPLK